MIWADGALLGEYTTCSFGESPSEENVSRLSQILEASAPPRFSLSAKACEGILRRAERRGKVLPEQLEAALTAQSVSKSERDAQFTITAVHSHAVCCFEPRSQDGTPRIHEGGCPQRLIPHKEGKDNHA